MGDFSIDVEHARDGAVVHIGGEVDMETTPVVETVVGHLTKPGFDDGPGRVTFDLGR